MDETDYALSRIGNDYDGTLASHGRVSEETFRALQAAETVGATYKILVTGRRLDDLLAACSYERIFDLIVAENRAVAYSPITRQQTQLTKPPSKLFWTASRLVVSSRWRWDILSLGQRRHIA